MTSAKSSKRSAVTGYVSHLMGLPHHVAPRARRRLDVLKGSPGVVLDRPALPRPARRSVSVRCLRVASGLCTSCLGTLRCLSVLDASQVALGDLCKTFATEAVIVTWHDEIDVKLE